jgi:hypothetical protein
MESDGIMVRQEIINAYNSLVAAVVTQAINDAGSICHKRSSQAEEFINGEYVDPYLSILGIRKKSLIDYYQKCKEGNQNAI